MGVRRGKACHLENHPLASQDLLSDAKFMIQRDGFISMTPG